jgi:hypothetical protein
MVGITGAIVQVMDKSFGNTYILPTYDIFVFGIMILISSLIQYILIKIIRDTARIEGSKSKIGKTILTAAIVLQFSASGLLAIILFEVLLTSEYSIMLLQVTVGISLISFSVILAILSSRFMRSFRYFQSKIVLAYMIAIAALSLNGIVTFIYIDSFVRVAAPGDFITSGFNPWSSFSPTSPSYFRTLYQLTGIISFVTMWIATVFMMSHYFSRSKRIIYWAMVSAPLIYFASPYLISFLEDLDLLRQLGVYDSTVSLYAYNLLKNTVTTAGGLMFGFAFFVLSRTITHTQLKNSVVMSGVGLILLFGANATSLIIMTTYPPWGVLSTTFLIVGSYSLIIGLDSAGLYIATDSSLRRIIQNSPRMNYDILRSFGHTKVEEIVTRKVDSISKQVYQEIKSDNLFRLSSEPTNVREYVDEVLKEVSRGDPGQVRRIKDKSNVNDLG